MKYIGIIADGNRRWAKQYGLPPESGWAQGLVAIERVVLWAQQHEIEQISIFLWST
jgi:undecaprenyl diphosphate synthase